MAAPNSADLALTSDETYQEARSFHLSGNLLEARLLYANLISFHPSAASLRSNSGVLALQSGNLGEGLGRIRSALILEPRRSRDYLNLAQCDLLSKQLELATLHAKRALFIDPALTEAYAVLGDIYRTQGSTGKAINSYLITIVFSPETAAAYNNIGTLFSSQSAEDIARRYYIWGTYLSPLSFEIQINLSRSLIKLTEMAQAREHLGAMTKLRGPQSDTLELWSEIELFQKNQEVALKYATQALQLNPERFSLYILTGVALFELQKAEESQTFFQKAIRINPLSSIARHNFAKVEIESGLLPSALREFSLASLIDPSSIDHLIGLGNALDESLEFEKACDTFSRAELIDPNSTHAAESRIACECHSKLVTGNYVDGWRAHEQRFIIHGYETALRDYPQPRYTGQNIHGKRIYVYWEQGLGDTIQFCRFAKVLANQGAQVFLQVQVPLKVLMRSLDPSVIILGPDDPVPEFDYHSPLLSLPFALGTSLLTVPKYDAYLSPWAINQAEILKEDTRKTRVGIAWSGSSVFKRDSRRSMGFSDLEDLFNIKGVEYHCLQKEVREKDMALISKSKEIIFHVDELHDFNSTASIAMQMDLVISVDTSLAHLAGALGLPVWVLVAYRADHRWLLDRSDSPWYPSATIFRQSERRSWREVINRVSTAISQIRDQRNIHSSDPQVR